MTTNNGICRNTGKHTAGRKIDWWVGLLTKALFAFLLCLLLLFILSRTKVENNSRDIATPNPTVTQNHTVTEQVQPLIYHELVYTGETVQEQEEPAAEEETVYYYSVNLSHDLQDYIRELCEQYDVPMSLVIAMIDMESCFDPNAVSETNDYGLMQINTINHEWLRKEIGITDILDPYQNVLSGIYILSGHLEATDGDIELALMRYNCGATGAKNLWNKGIYSTSYTQKIMNCYSKYEESRLGAVTP